MVEDVFLVISADSRVLAGDDTSSTPGLDSSLGSHPCWMRGAGAGSSGEVWPQSAAQSPAKSTGFLTTGLGDAVVRERFLELCITG